MRQPFLIRDVTAWPTTGDEVMGSKPKVWLEDGGRTRWLFKERHRAHTGDDWAEKVAAEVADVLGLPHAAVGLADRGGRRGVITRDLVADLGGQALVLGNSLLVEADPAYPTGHRYHVADHTLDRVYDTLARPAIGLPAATPAADAVRTAPDLFTGYLMLDAPIGNTDRHHENWGVVLMTPGGEGPPAVLCPSFDHASCLGHNVRDAERTERLSTRDVNRTVAAYVRSPKGRSALYRERSDPKPMTPLEAFRAAAAKCPAAGAFWLSRLGGAPADAFTDIVAGIPGAIMSDVCKRFAAAVLTANRANLLE